MFKWNLEIHFKFELWKKKSFTLFLKDVLNVIWNSALQKKLII